MQGKCKKIETNRVLIIDGSRMQEGDEGYVKFRDKDGCIKWMYSKLMLLTDERAVFVNRASVCHILTPENIMAIEDNGIPEEYRSIVNDMYYGMIVKSKEDEVC